MITLIVGLGSIAQKHINALKEINTNFTFIALRSGKSKSSDDRVDNIYSLDELNYKPDFVIISNPTSKHYDTIKRFLSLEVPLFIEKPVLMSLASAFSLLEEINDAGILTYVGCNLRFHPCIQFLKDNLGTKRLYEANIYCGSYLPDWRPNRDYRQTYSAKSEMGGGVHLDLIHEIDYSYWLWGKPTNVNNSLRRISDLEINSVDYAHYRLEYPQKTVTITLSYYRKKAKRRIELVFKDDVWKVDLLKGTVTDFDNNVIFSADFDISETYVQQMEYFISLLGGKNYPMNDFKESLEILNICLNE